VDSRVVEFTVKVPESFFGEILNSEYQVSSEEVMPPIQGDPVVIKVIAPYQIYLPWIGGE
jgi:hypothetical protein